MAQRYEITRLDGAKRTPQGGIKAEAALTRTGVFVYRREDGSEVREYRSPEEVFKADSLATLSAAPVTKLHPPELVTSKNYKKYSCGTVSETVKQDGDKVVATVYVQDAELAQAIEKGEMKQVSCGYVCDIEDRNGVTESGERYDRVQTNIRYNHAAIVPVGRAGADISLRLDGADNEIILRFDAETTGEIMKEFELVQGVKYELGTEAHKAACERRDAAEKAQKDSFEKLQARCDAAEAEVARQKKELAELPVKIQEQAKARAALEASARKVLGSEAKFDGLSDSEVRKAVISEARPEIKLDGKGDAYVEALFDIVSTQEHSDLSELNRQASEVPQGERKDSIDELDLDQIRADSLKKVQDLWRMPVDEFKNFGKE